jgi:hypothetical protein
LDGGISVVPAAEALAHFGLAFAVFAVAFGTNGGESVFGVRRLGRHGQQQNARQSEDFGFAIHMVLVVLCCITVLLNYQHRMVCRRAGGSTEIVIRLAFID